MTDPRAVKEAAIRRAARRYLVVLGVVVVLLAVAFAVRQVPDEAYGSGLSATAALDARFAAVRDGELELPETPGDLGDGIQGAQLELREGVAVWVLVRQDGDRCYGMHWDDALIRSGRTVASNRPCVAATFVASNRPTDFDRAGRFERDPGAVYDWTPVLPDPMRLRFWFLPAVIVLGGVALSMLVRLSVLAITREPPSNWDRRR